jgi:hypothetical protein
MATRWTRLKIGKPLRVVAQRKIADKRWLDRGNVVYTICHLGCPGVNSALGS